MAVPKQVLDQIKMAEDSLNQEPQEAQSQEEAVQQSQGINQQQEGDSTQQHPQMAPSENWEHKYKVLQGKYNAEVPRLHQELKQARHEIEFLKGKLAMMETLLAQKPINEPVRDDDNDEVVKKLKEEFPDIYSAVKRMLDKYAPKHELNEIATKVDTRVKQTEEQVQQKLYSAFLAQLAQKVPDWQVLNVDPEFLEWLSGKDRLSTRTRHELMLEAFQAGDVDTVAEFFLAYKEAKKQQAPQQQPNIVPPAGRSSPPTGKPKPIYKQSEIEEFYRLVALGRIPPDVKRKKEEEFISAMQEGRVLLNS